MSMLAHAMHNGPQVLMSRQGFTESDGQPGLQHSSSAASSHLGGKAANSFRPVKPASNIGKTFYPEQLQCYVGLGRSGRNEELQVFYWKWL